MEWVAAMSDNNFGFGGFDSPPSIPWGRLCAVQVGLLTGNEFDRNWYEFDCLVEHSVDTARRLFVQRRNKQGMQKEKTQMCAGTPIWVGKHKSSSSQDFFSCFNLLSLFIREWERGLLGDLLLLRAPSVATLPLHNHRQGGLTAMTLWESGGLCEPRVGA
jgi:hypothetical protein